jgi:hypothetical protein
MGGKEPQQAVVGSLQHGVGLPPDRAPVALATVPLPEGMPGPLRPGNRGSMTIVQEIRRCDPAVLASRVRKFAILAHRARKDPACRDRQAPELARHLAFLEDPSANRPGSELALWVGNARRALGPV